MSFCAPVFSGAVHPSALRVLPQSTRAAAAGGARLIDLGDDFVAMIAARRAYLAASRVGAIAGRMLADLARIVN